MTRVKESFPEDFISALHTSTADGGKPEGFTPVEEKKPNPVAEAYREAPLCMQMHEAVAELQGLQLAALGKGYGCHLDAQGCATYFSIRLGGVENVIFCLLVDEAKLRNADRLKTEFKSAARFIGLLKKQR